MRSPIFVRRLTDAKRCVVETGLRSSDASANGVLIPQIAHNLACNQQTVRNAIHDFNSEGTAALINGSSRANTIYRALDAARVEQLRDLSHRSPRDFGYPTSLWTLDSTAEEAFLQGLADHDVTGEIIRATLVRLGVRWRRAKEWRDGSGQRHSASREEIGPTLRLVVHQP